MIKDDTLINVRNRNNGTTGYVLPDNNVRRSFAPQETKKIPFGELKSLQYAPGGSYLLDNLLIIEDKEALNLLNMKVEPEYFYDENKIRELLLTGSIDEFLDFLDFATEGAIEIAKDIAVKEKIPDNRKREAISKKTGLNINSAIMVNEVMDAEDEKSEEEKPERRVKENAETAPKRRTAVPSMPSIPAPSAPKYNVISQG